MIEVDDVEEANLSEYNGSSPLKNSCDRYSDLRGSIGGSDSKKERSNSNIEIPFKNESKKSQLSNSVHHMEQGSLLGSTRFED